MDFWDNALPLMRNKKVKKMELVRLTGHSSGTISDWFSRRIMPKADDALKIADYLGVSVRFLVTGKDEDMPFKLREVVELCRGLGDDELDTVCRMLRGLRKEKKDGHESDMVVG